jgi:hypothetical protein
MKRKLWLLFLLVVIGGGVYLWLHQDEITESFNQERAEDREKFTQEGLQYGQAHSQQACLDKTLTDLNGCNSFGCSVNAGLFLKHCWNVASESPAMCDGVPAFQEKPSEDDKTWAKAYCIDRDIRSEGCRKLIMRQLSQFCSK